VLSSGKTVAAEENVIAPDRRRIPPATGTILVTVTRLLLPLPINVFPAMKTG
jgi:hypothetical protein